MVKIAELINGTTICGDFKDHIWTHVFSFYLTQKEDSKSQTTINFTPLIMLGDFDQPMKIDESKYSYIYDAGSKFIHLYRQRVVKLQEARSRIASASPADIFKFKGGKIIEVK